MHTTGRFLLIMVMALAGTGAFGAGEGGQTEEAASTANVTIERVALFKNGLGYFESKAVLPSGATSIRLGQLPVPVLGTFWVDYPQSLAVRNLVTSMEPAPMPQTVGSLGELLRVNEGRFVRLYLRTDEARILEGRIMPRKADWLTYTPRSPYAMNPNIVRDNRITIGGGVDITFIETDSGVVGLQVHTIERVEFEGEANTVTSERIEQPAMRVELDEPAAGEALSVDYLAKGITWAPAYRIDLSDPAQAQVSARALVINEAADLDNVHLDLVTGFPNIQFSDVLSPVAKSEPLAEFLEALANGRSEDNARRVTGQRVVTSNSMVFENIMPGYSAAEAGQTAEDLFLYPIENVTLRNGETAWLPLFTERMPYRHIYTWTIPDFIEGPDSGRSSGNGENARQEEVWHSCRLTNALDMPLTTAPAEFITDGAFTGQDTCYYTGPGAETTIRMNLALNVQARQSEVEIQRTVDALEDRSARYDQVRLKGELELRNRTKEPVTVEIQKHLSGNVLSSAPEAKDVITAEGLKSLNPSHVLTWEVEVAPEATQSITYEFTVLVRR